MNYLIPGRPFRGMNRFPEDFDIGVWGGVLGSPLADLEDRGDHYQLVAEVPGVSRENLRIHVTETSVHLQGAQEQRAETREGNYLRRERRHGSFQRTFSLPSPVSPEEARAHFEDGVLTIDLPKEGRTRGRDLRIEG
jgi:HSP20 family protein